MANDTSITMVGNLTKDPELTFTAAGDARAVFTVASTPRTYDKTSSQWVDGEPMFLECTAWRQPAENITETLSKGDRVIVTGRLRQHHWDTPEGDKRSRICIDVEDVGPSLRFATAKIHKAHRTTTPAADTSATTPTPAASSGATSPEPPF